jgi:hypothetical protein
MRVLPDANLELTATERPGSVDPSPVEAIEVLKFGGWIDNVERPFALFQALTNERQEYRVGFVRRMEEGAYMSRALERHVGQSNLPLYLSHAFSLEFAS